MIDITKKSFKILNQSNKKKLIILTFFNFFVVVLELFTLGILVKVLETVSKSDSDAKNIFLHKMEGMLDGEGYIFLIVGIFFLFYICKSILIFTFYSKQFKFTFDLKAELTSKVFKNYLFSPYSFFLKNKTEKLMRNTSYEVGLVTTGIIHNLITIGSEFLIVLSIIIFSFVKYPVIVINLSIFLTFIGVIYLYSAKTKIEKLGNLRQSINTDVIKKTLNGLFGIKDIKILGKEGNFSKIFQESSFSMAKVSRKISIYAQIPKLLLEVSLIVVITVILLRISNISTLIQVGGLILFAGLRMIPSIAKIVAGVQFIKYYKPSMDVVYDLLADMKNNNLETEVKSEEKKIEFKNQIEFQDVNYSYNKDRLIFENLNFSINKGDKIGIFGGSGQGKSTFIDLLVYLLKPTSGKILVDGIILSNSNETNWRKKIGYVPQKVYITNDTLRNNIALGVDKKDIDDVKIMEIIKKTNLTNFRSSEEQNNIMDVKLNDRGLNISGGELQRIALARSLYIDSEILVLDEATNSLDRENKEILIKNVFDLFKDKTIIFISHEENAFKSCNKIFELKNNKFHKIK